MHKIVGFSVIIIILLLEPHKIVFIFAIETGARGDEDSSDSEGWEEREASRTHSVKFSEDSRISDKDTPFVRQNTPHPKELKMKAHKLFAKEKNKGDDGDNLDTLSEEVSSWA